MERHVLWATALLYQFHEHVAFSTWAPLVAAVLSGLVGPINTAPLAWASWLVSLTVASCFSCLTLSIYRVHKLRRVPRKFVLATAVTLAALAWLGGIIVVAGIYLESAAILLGSFAIVSFMPQLCVVTGIAAVWATNQTARLKEKLTGTTELANSLLQLEADDSFAGGGGSVMLDDDDDGDGPTSENLLTRIV